MRPIKRLAVAGSAAGGVMVILAAGVFACTTFQGHFTVCGDASSTCITATGSGSGMNKTTTGSTAVSNTKGSATASGDGLTPNTNYTIKFNPPATASVDCMTSGAPIGVAQTDGSGAFTTTTPSPMTVPSGTQAGLGTVCISDATQSTGNEAPVSVM